MLVAQRVVDLLEAIEVHEQHTDLLARPPPRDRLVDPLVEADPVRKAREAVVNRVVAELLDELRVRQDHLGMAGQRGEQREVGAFERRVRVEAVRHYHEPARPAPVIKLDRHEVAPAERRERLLLGGRHRSVAHE